MTIDMAYLWLHRSSGGAIRPGPKVPPHWPWTGDVSCSTTSPNPRRQVASPNVSLSCLPSTEYEKVALE